MKIVILVLKYKTFKTIPHRNFERIYVIECKYTILFFVKIGKNGSHCDTTGLFDTHRQQTRDNEKKIIKKA